MSRACPPSSASTATTSPSTAAASLINLKPQGERGSNVSDVIRRLRSETAGVAGVTLYMQPVQEPDPGQHHQPHPVSIHPGKRGRGGPDHMDTAAADGPAPTARTGGRRQQSGRKRPRRLHHHRPGQRRPPRDQRGHRRQCLVRRLRPAHRVHHFHAVEPIPGHSGGGSRDYQSVESLASIYVPSAGGGQVPLSAIAKVAVENRPLLINHLAQFPATTVSFNLSQGASPGRRGDRDRSGGEDRRPAGEHPVPPSREPRSPSAAISATSCCCWWRPYW